MWVNGGAWLRVFCWQTVVVARSCRHQSALRHFEEKKSIKSYSQNRNFRRTFFCVGHFLFFDISWYISTTNKWISKLCFGNSLGIQHKVLLNSTLAYLSLFVVIWWLEISAPPRFWFWRKFKISHFFEIFGNCKQTTLRYRASAACKGHNELGFRFSKQCQALPTFSSWKLTLYVVIQFSKRKIADGEKIKFRLKFRFWL